MSVVIMCLQLFSTLMSFKIKPTKKFWCNMCWSVCVFIGPAPGEVDDIEPNLRKENVLNNLLLEDGTFLYMATKVWGPSFMLTHIIHVIGHKGIALSYQKAIV
jgi:hypothetical protein